MKNLKFANPGLRLALITAMALGLANAAFAQTAYYWIGQDEQNSLGPNWSFNNQWSLSPGGASINSALPSAQNYLNFDGNAPGGTLVNSNDTYNAAFQIYFKNSVTAPFTLIGNPLTFYDYSGTDPNIQNEGASFTNFINLAITNGNNNGTYRILNINGNTSPAQGPITFNGPIYGGASDANPRVINVGGGIVTFNGALANGAGGGTLGLTLLGGTNILTGVNTYTGPTTISAGTLTLNGSGSLGSGTYSAVVTNNGSLMHNSTAAQTISGVISGGGSLTQQSSGTLTLSGANTYSGGTTVSAGTLSGNNTSAFGTGTINLNNSGTLAITAGTVANSLNIGAGATATLNLSSGLTYAGSFSGSGTVTNYGNGYSQSRTYSSTGNSGFTGTIVLERSGHTFTGNNADWSGANFQAANTSADTALTANFTGTGTTVINSFNGLDSASLQIGPGTVLDVQSGSISRITYGSVFLNATPIIGPTGGNGGKLTSDSGTLTFNTAAGAITENTGIALADYSGPTLLNLVASGGANTLTLNGANTYTGTTTINSGNTLAISGAGSLGSGNYAGNITDNGTLNYGSSAAETLGGIISGAGALTDSGSGTLTLSGANTYSGPTTISAGTLRIGADNNLGTAPGSATAGNVVVNGGALSASTGFTLDANRGLALGPTGGSGGGTIDVASGQVLAYGGIAANNGSGTGSLTKTGAGTLTLSGANTYSGATTISAGTLALSGSGNIASSTPINIVPGGLLDVSGTTSTFALGSGITLNAGRASNPATDINGNFSSGGTINVAGSGTNGTLTIAGNLALAGGSLAFDLLNPSTADLITLSGAGGSVALSGTTTVTPVNGLLTNGTYNLVNGVSSIAGGTSANLALGAVGNVRGAVSASFNVSSPAITMTVSGVGPTNLFWQGNVSSAWDLNTTANWTNRPGGSADKFFNLDTVNFDDTALASASGTNVSIATALYPGTVSFNNSSRIFGLGGSGSIAGAASLAKSGTSLVIISNANSYSGGTVINAGMLRLATANALGNGTGPLTMSGGTLDLNTNNLSVQTLSGTGGNISNTVRTATATTSTVTVNQLATGTFAGLILKGTGTTTNDVALVKNGTGYLTISGANTYSGATTVNAGTLEIKNHSGNEGSITVAQGATLKYGYNTVGSGGYGQSVTINGNGASDPAGFYILGGKSFNSDTLTIQTQPTTVHQYGSGTATIHGYDVNHTHLSVASTASGTVIDPLITFSCQGYGYRINVVSGANNAAGDLLIGGPIIGTAGNNNGGPYITNVRKDGTGSLLITNACTYSQGMYITGGSVMLAGAANRLPATSGVILTGGSLLQLNGISQTLTNISINTGSGNAVVGGSATISTLTINNGGADNYAGNLGGTAANQNNLALVKTGAGLLTLSGRTTYTGNTTVSAGVLLAGFLTNQDNSTLSVADTAGSLLVTNLTLGTSSGSTVAITGLAGANAAPIITTNLTINGVTTITLAGSFTSGQYPLIQFLTGTIGGSGSFAVQQSGLPRGVTASIVTNVPNSSIDVVLTAYPLIWVGATNGVNVATWDNGVTTNWNLADTPNYFTNNDNVQLDDTAIGSTTLTLATNVSPVAVLVTNNALNYTIGATGASALTGGMSLTKQGIGALTLASSNSFTGGVTISGGVVNIQNGYAFNTNTVTVNTGTELQLQGGISVPSVTVLTLKSAGTNNTGGLRNIDGNNTFGGPVTLTGASRINSDSGTLTLTNAVAGGANHLSLGGAGTIAISTTISGSAGVVEDGSGTNIWNNNPAITGGGLTVNGGLMRVTTGNFAGAFTPLITVNTNGTLLNDNYHALGGGTALVLNHGTWIQNYEDYKQSLTLMDGTIAAGSGGDGGDLRVGNSGGNGIYTWYVSNSVAGSVVNLKVNTVGSGITNAWNVSRGAAASDLTINAPIYNAGSFVLTGNGITTLTATNTYSGNTLVSGGTLVVASTGVIPANTVTLTNATLAGNGLIKGSTTIQLNSTLQPGLGGTDTSALTISNSVTLAGNAQFTLDNTNTQNSTCVAGISTVTYGGTLTLTNAGPALQAGDTFTLFQAANYAGGFTNLVLPDISPLVWNTNNLAVNGSISVAALPAVTVTPSITNVYYGNSVVLTATPSGTGPFAYQWFDNNTNAIAGATTPTLTLSSPAVAASGNYSVVVTTAVGNAGSLAVVTVNPTNLTITANDDTKTYGQTKTYGAGSAAFTSSGLQNGEIIGSVTITATSTPVDGTATNAPAGSYALTPSAATGGTFNAANYNIMYDNGTLTVVQAATFVGAISTENPSGYKDAVAYIATLPVDATGSVVFSSASGPFSTNAVSGGAATSLSISNLPRGTNVITFAYSGDGNYLGSTNSLDQIVTNHPPVAQIMTVTRTAGLNLRVSLSDVATNWSDVDGDTVALAGINLVSTNGVNLTTNSSWIMYTNSPNVNDQLSYSLADSFGGTNVGYINIVVVQSVPGAYLINNITTGASNTVTSYGVPGYTYILERTTNIAPPVWIDIFTNTAATNGVINGTDTFWDLGGTPPASAYYRLKWQP